MAVSVKNKIQRNINLNKEKFVNQKDLFQILGYTQKEIIGKNWFDNFLPVKIKKQMKNVFSQLIVGKTEFVENYENLILTKKREEKIVAMQVTGAGIIVYPEQEVFSEINTE